ncbi:MAG: Shedu immune nuclease family protein [Elainellaceae cyanobacterium]
MGSIGRDIIRPSFDAQDSDVRLTELGFSLLAQWHYFGGRTNPKNIDDLLEHYREKAKAHLGALAELENFFSNKFVPDKIVEELEGCISATNVKSNEQVWAARTINATYLLENSLLAGGIEKAVLAMHYLVNCQAMLVFETSIKDLAWKAHQVSKLKDLLRIWNANQDNQKEKFWQVLISENPILYSQILNIPVVLVKENACINGVSIGNIKSRKFIDFLIKNQSTENLLLIEIKTPVTYLLDKQYRKNHNISKELTGSVIQALNYKRMIMENYHSMASEYKDEKFYSFNPCCLVIAGNLTKEMNGDSEKIRSFELFRSELKDVKIITYDELFKKVDSLIKILSHSPTR